MRESCRKNFTKKTDIIEGMLSDLEEIKKTMLPVLKEAGVIRSSLFGSAVTGEARPDSDLDVLVEFPQGKSLLDLIRLERKLTEATNKDVDLLTYGSLHPLLKERILKEQVTIL